MLIPKNRHEYYLAVISGNDYPTFPPKTREELYLAKLAGREVDVPSPKTPKERAYYNIINDIKFEPENRWQTFVAAANDDSITAPIPRTREEIWWTNISLSHEVIVEYVGTLPTTLTGTKAGYLESYKIYGNTAQDGTPTPENPIVPSGCGERTGNLLRCANTTRTTGGNAVIEQIAGKSEIMLSRTATNADTSLTIDVLAELGAGTYTLSAEGIINRGARNLDRIYIRDENNNIIANNIQTGKPQRFTVSEDVKITKLSFVFAAVAEYDNQVVRVMLNLGTAPLPYEPFGYKLPLTVNGVEYPIYLGGIETTRRIKRLVLTGTESWTQSTDKNFKSDLPKESIAWKGIFCTHFSKDQITYNSKVLILRYNNTNFETSEEVKSYLAAQYAAGTPVTVWYVLAKPETGIVNEPLMKIDNYADTVSMEQAGVSIPTAAGTTVIDYNGEPKPDKVELTYKTIKRNYISADDKVYQDPNGQLLGG